MLDFDGQALDPAIVSAQPMKPLQTLDLQQMGCPSSECRLIYHHSEHILSHTLLLTVLSLFSYVCIYSESVIHQLETLL